MVNEADILRDKTKEQPELVRGVSPSYMPIHVKLYPIRKRGYYRALKRKESWAVIKDMTNKLCEQFTKKLFEPFPVSAFEKEKDF